MLDSQNNGNILTENPNLLLKVYINTIVIKITFQNQ